LSAEDLSKSIGEDPPIWGLCSGVGAVMVRKLMSKALETWNPFQVENNYDITQNLPQDRTSFSQTLLY